MACKHELLGKNVNLYQPVRNPVKGKMEVNANSLIRIVTHVKGEACVRGSISQTIYQSINLYL